MTVKKRRGPGRPPKRRNTVSTKDDIQRAMNSGMSLTQLKDYIETMIEHPEEGMDSKQILDYIKVDLQLWEFLTKNYKMFTELEDKVGKAETSSSSEKSSNKVVAFSLKS